MKMSTIASFTAAAAVVLTAGCSAGRAADDPSTGTSARVVESVQASTVTSAAVVGSSPGATSPVQPVTPAEKREFLFQIDRYDTANQGGQTLNMYFHYRYNDGIAESDIPNYVDLRTHAIAFMDAVDASQNPYWETLNQQLCSQLHADFPIEAISCQLQVYPDDRAGLPYEPGFHSSIETIGDLPPLSIVGPVTTG